MTRQEQQERNRERLVQAAQRVLADRGIHATRLESLALEVGLTKGAVYSNFQSKGELVLAALASRRGSPEGEAFARILSDEGDDPWARFEQWVQLWVDTFTTTRHRQFARVLLEFVPYALRDPSLHGRLARLFAPAADTDPDEGPGSPIPPDSPLGRLPVADQMRIVQALDLGLVIQDLADPGRVSPELYRVALRLLVGAADRGATDPE